MATDWSAAGVDWRDESMDEVMAQDWLRASRGSALYDTDVFDRVLELTQSDLDRERGWRLVKRLVELASSERDLWQVGAGPLSTMVREHKDVIGDELAILIRGDPKFRQATHGQISTALDRFLKDRADLDELT